MLSRRTFLSLPIVPALCGQGGKARMFADAEAYERFMGRWSRLVAPQLIDFTGVPKSGQFLDVGSGTGALSFALAERRPLAHVQGIDPSQEYVAFAESRNRFPARVSFLADDAQQLRFRNATFDASLSLLVFNFIPDPRKALREVRRVTKTGGRISAAVWDYGDGMRMLRAFWDSAAVIDARSERLDEKHLPLCRAGELAELWRQGGLEDVREQPQVITMRFTSFADYWDPFLLGQGPAGVFMKSLNRDQVRAMRDELKSRLSRGREDLPIKLSARVWSVCGTVPRRA